MTIRKTLAEQSREPRNKRLSDEDAQVVWERLQAGETITAVHKDYAHIVSRATIKRVANGERIRR